MARIVPLVNSLPKSGTNLVQKLVELLGFRYARLGIAESLIRGRWFLARQLVRGAFFDENPITVGLDAPVSISSSWLDRRLKRVPQGHYISGHANYTERLHYYLRRHGIRTIQVIRDPRDVVVSHVHFFAKKEDYFLYPLFSTLSFAERLDVTLNGGMFFGGKLHLESFATVLSRVDPWVSKSHGDVLVVRFEDLVGPKGGGEARAQLSAIRRIVEFLGLGKSITDDRISSIAEQLFGGTHTFRSGRIGTWVDELSPDQQQRVSSATAAIREKWGY